MTREEAIDTLKAMQALQEIYRNEAVDMAIEALINEQKTHNGDLISRKETLRGYQSVCKDIACHECRVKDVDGACRLESFINNLPTAGERREP